MGYLNGALLRALERVLRNIEIIENVGANPQTGE
jgi:hypothetical protein